MRNFLKIRDHGRGLWQLLQWSMLIVPVAILAGSASALFLWGLDRVTELRWNNPWLLFLLPIAGMCMVWAYERSGKGSERGNNLVIDEIHEPGGGVPARMAPLVLIATWITHLFGGSAGREGTAVQMGGSIASAFARLFRVQPETSRILLLSGVAAGFGSVFGTPLAGAVFAMEVLTVGRLKYEALFPTLLAAVVADFTCSAWGIKHSIYHLAFTDPISEFGYHVDPLLFGKVILAAIGFGLVSLLFADLAHGLQKAFGKIPWAPLRPFVGGVIVIGLVYALGSRDYLGLGVSSPDAGAVTIFSAFEMGGADPFSWWWKILFTVITLSSGFKGGEVTPLFFIGATLGNLLAWVFDAPVDLFAALGFIAVFAGATNTPLACTILGVELFGAQNTVYFATACYVAYYFSGFPGIYSAQRLDTAKVSEVKFLDSVFRGRADSGKND